MASIAQQKGTAARVPMSSKQYGYILQIQIFFPTRILTTFRSAGGLIHSQPNHRLMALQLPVEYCDITNHYGHQKNTY